MKNQNKHLVVEVCAQSLDCVELAARYGAKRVELCNALQVGGLTPNIGLVKASVAVDGIETHVMIRHRQGGFYVSDEDIGIMYADIKAFAVAGVKGVVFGCLTKECNIDLTLAKILLKLAKSHGLEVTFHRAFDFVKAPLQALNQLIELGFDRVLTSGGTISAIDGQARIKDLASHAKGRIQIMAGSGIDADNIPLLARTGIDAIHFTAHRPVGKTSLGMGVDSIPDKEKMAAIFNYLKTL